MEVMQVVAAITGSSLVIPDGFDFVDLNLRDAWNRQGLFDPNVVVGKAKRIRYDFEASGLRLEAVVSRCAGGRYRMEAWWIHRTDDRSHLVRQRGGEPLEREILFRGEFEAVLRQDAPTIQKIAGRLLQ